MRRRISFLFLILSIISLLLPICTSGKKFPTFSTPPYYAGGLTSEVVYATAPLRIDGPKEMTGSLFFQITPWAGPLFLSANTTSYDVKGPIILLHSSEVCQNGRLVEQTQNDEGQPYAGSIILIWDDPSCQTIKQFDRSGAIAIGIMRTDKELTPSGSWQTELTGSMSLSAFDSSLLNTYLQCRRMWFKAGKPAIWTQVTTQCLSIASSFTQPLMGTLVGTNVTLQSDIDALRDIANVMIIDPNSITPYEENAYGSWSTLGSWSAFATNYSIDPCVQRLAGLYCEQGRIVMVNLESLGVQGTIPDSWGNLTMLRFINLGFGNQFGGLTGHVPHSLTKLINLQNLILDDNKLLSLPEHVGNLTNLLVLRIRLNLLSTLPESLGDLQSLVVLDISVNAFQFSPTLSSVATTRSNVSQATALLQIFRLSSILDMNLQDNALYINCSHVNFHSFMQVEKLILTNISMFGEFASDAFDGLSTLNLIDLSNNKIEGAIPAFNNCQSLSSFAISSNLLQSPLPLFSARPPSLTSISLDHNFFYGELPQEWTGLESLTTIFLSNNQLAIGNLRVLRSMKNIQHVDLSHNQIYIDPYYNGDFGFFLWETMSLTLVSLNLNYNQLSGKFSSGWLDKVQFTSLSMSNNQLQALAPDLFDSALTSIDISNNQLTGSFPSSPPRFTVDLREYNPVTFINFQNNSNFLNHSVSTSPRSLNWIVQANPTEYIQKNQMLCPKLASQSSSLTLLVDPGFIGWDKCVCAPLTTGSPPTCKPIPALLAVSPFLKPQLDATSSSNMGANAASNNDISSLLMMNPWFQLDGNTMQIQLIDNRTVPSLDTLNTNASLPAFTQLWPPSFSDAWYYKPPLDAGLAADSLSLSTSWKISLGSIRWDVNNQVQFVDESLTDATLANQISPSSDVPQPVRVVTLLLHISRTAFSDSDILDVYNSQLNLVTRLEKANLYNTAHPNYYNASLMPNWSEYLRVYGKALSTLSDYVTMRIQIAGNAANVVLNSIDRPVVRFVATYSYAFDCSTLPVASRIVFSDSGYQCLFDSPSSYLPFGQTGFECKGQVDPLNSNSLLQLEDPAALNYHGCRCSIGKFGNPPICDLIPVTSVLSPVSEPQASSPSLSNYSFMALDPTLVQSAASISSIMSTTNSSGPLPWHRIISDSWFGLTRRFSAGFSSSWIIDLQRFRQGPSQNPTSSDEEFSTAIYTDFSPVASTIIGPEEMYQPVRSITIRVHVDAAAFAGASNTLSVFVGNSSSGDRKLFLNGNDPSFQSCPTFSAYTSSLEYQNDYGAALAKFTIAPCLFEVLVLSNQASIFFSSRDADSSHFLATYSYQFGVCPAELVIDPTTNMCLQKFTLSSAAPAAVYATAAITCAWILLQLVFLGLKWTAPIYRASSRPFLLLQIGLLLTLAASSVLYAQVPSPNTTSGTFICLGRAWFTGISITGLLAVLLSKTLRVYRLFSNAILTRRVDVSDQSILKTVVAITLIQVVLLLIFSGVPVSKPVVQHGLGILSDQLVASCSDDSAGFWPVMILEFIFIFTLIVVSLGLAFKTRNTPSAFNDNTQIFQCLISIFVLSIFVIALVLWLARADPDAAVFLQGIGQCLFAFVMTCWLLFPKAFVALTTSVEEQKAMAETYANTSAPKTSLPSNTKSSSNTSKSTPGGSNSTSAKPGTGVMPNGMAGVPRPLPTARPSVNVGAGAKAPLPQVTKRNNPPSPAVAPTRAPVVGSPTSVSASPTAGSSASTAGSPAADASPSVVKVVLTAEEPKSSAPSTPATKALIPSHLKHGEDSSTYSLSTSPASKVRRINDGTGDMSEPTPGTVISSSSADTASPMSPSSGASHTMQSIPTSKMLDALSQIESASFFVQRLKVRLKSANGQVSPEAVTSSNANGL